MQVKYHILLSRSNCWRIPPPFYKIANNVSSTQLKLKTVYKWSTEDRDNLFFIDPLDYLNLSSVSTYCVLIKPYVCMFQTLQCTVTSYYKNISMCFSKKIHVAHPETPCVFITVYDFFTGWKKTTVTYTRQWLFTYMTYEIASYLQRYVLRSHNTNLPSITKLIYMYSLFIPFSL